MSFVKGILQKSKVKMASQRTLQCIFRPIDKDEIFLLLDFPTCHLNSCNFGQDCNFLF